MSTNVLAHLPALTRLVINMNGITGVSFCSLSYENAQGEKQQNLINIGVSYATAKEKDIALLETLTVADYPSLKGFDAELLESARVALLEALKNPNEARSKGQINAYTNINSGLKYHNETGELFIYGNIVKKTVVAEGTKKVVNSAPLTIAKDAIRKLMKSTQYRQYKVTMTGTAKLKGDTLIFE